MTSQSDRIQSLVDQINTILDQSSTEGGFKADEYRALEQAQQNLMHLQQSSSSPSSQVVAVPDASEVMVQDWQSPSPVLAESAQQILQSIVQEMAYLRMNTVQPLREEITQLQHERNQLASEVQQLQHQRQQLLVAQQTDQQQMINGFLHALMGRLQEQLTLQVAQSIAELEGNPSNSLVTANDEQVVQLDSTLRVVFDSLQSNVTTYQDSLEQGLRKMHGLGQQGEAMFAAFVNRLASRLGQEASLHLQPSPPADWSSSPHDSGTGVTMPADDNGATLVDGAGTERTDYIYPLHLEQLLTQPIHEAGMEQEPHQQPGAENITQSSSNKLSTPYSPSVPHSTDNDSLKGLDVHLEVDSKQGDLTAPSVAKANGLIDQIIIQIGNETIDAVEAIDQLDLGFGLDAIELADVPVDVSDDVPANIQLADDWEQAGKESENIGQVLEQEPISLASGSDLDTPLSPLASIQIDEDEDDVERLLNSIPSPIVQDGQETDFSAEAIDLSVGSSPLISETADIDRLSGDLNDNGDESTFLRQQLAAELHNENFGVDLLAEEGLGALETSSFPNSSTNLDSDPIVDHSSISFTINPKAYDVEREQDGTVDAQSSFETLSDPKNSDLYATFTSMNDESEAIPASPSPAQRERGDLVGSITEELLSEQTLLDQNLSDEPLIDESLVTGEGVENMLDDDRGIGDDLFNEILDEERLGDGIASGTPPLDTINQLTDLIEQEPPASDALSVPQSEMSYRSPDNTLDLLSNVLPDSELPEPALPEPVLPEFESLGSDLSPAESIAPSSHNVSSDGVSETSGFFANLDLQLDDATMSQLADDLSEMEPSDEDKSEILAPPSSFTNNSQGDDDLFTELQSDSGMSQQQAVEEERSIPPFSPDSSDLISSFLADGDAQTAAMDADQSGDVWSDDLADAFSDAIAPSDPIPSFSTFDDELEDQSPSHSSPQPFPESGASESIEDFLSEGAPPSPTDFPPTDFPPTDFPPTDPSPTALSPAKDLPLSSDIGDSLYDLLGEDDANASDNTLVSDRDSLQDFFKGEEIEKTAPLLELDDSRSNETLSETDETLSGTVANLFSDLLTEDVLSDQSADPSINPSSEDINSGIEARSENDAGDPSGLTPVSSTLDDLFFNDSPPVEPPTEAQSIAKPLAEEDAIPDTFSSFLEDPSELVSPNIPENAEMDGSEMDSLEEDFGDNFEDDDLTSLLQGLQDNPPSPSQLSGSEDAKTLADLLRGQGSARPPEPSSSSSSGVTTTLPPVPSDAQPFSSWFGEPLEGPDEQSDPEKKNNG